MTEIFSVTGPSKNPRYEDILLTWLLGEPDGPRQQLLDLVHTRTPRRPSMRPLADRYGRENNMTGAIPRTAWESGPWLTRRNADANGG